MRAIPHLAVEFVSAHEGLRLESYEDSAKQWTIGFGHTGPDIGAGRKINRNQAQALLIEDLETASERLEAVVRPEIIERLTESQYAALLSFAFNVGADPRWTIWKRLNAGHLDQVPIELMKFVNAGGRRIGGLVNRRTAEVLLWCDDAPDTRPAPPSSVTRLKGASPTPGDPVAFTRSPLALTSIAGAILAAPPLINQAMQAVEPYAQGSAWLQKLLGVMGGVGGVLTMGGLALLRAQKRSDQL